MGTRRFLHVLSASCLARADPHPTAPALGSSPPLSPHSSEGPGALSSDKQLEVGTPAVSFQAHAQTTVNIASEAAMASSIASLRCELHLSRAAFAAAPPSASAVWATSVVPAAGSNSSGVPLPYVRATRAHAPIHVNAPFNQSHKGGWKWSSCPHFTELHQLTHFHDESLTT